MSAAQNKVLVGFPSARDFEGELSTRQDDAPLPQLSRSFRNRKFRFGFRVKPGKLKTENARLKMLLSLP